MNDERLYINGQLVDLSPSTTIAKTLQCNDIASMESRQSSFTRTIVVPRTPKNVEIMGYLGIAGSSSNAPYVKNTADYYVGNEAIIRNGWAKVNSTSGGYELVIYDGLIDFYKAIENKTFSELDLSELNHDKNLQTVIESWEDATKYKYILADYNGLTTYSAGTDNSIINVDYQVPSVNVKWLWDKTFEHFGFAYDGSVFTGETFTNLWLTYPKGVTTTIEDELKFQSTDIVGLTNGSALQTFPNTKKSLFVKYDQISTDELPLISNDIHLFAPTTSRYRVEISGEIQSYRLVRFNTAGTDDLYSQFPQKVDLWLAKNANDIDNPDNVVPFMLLQANIGSTTSNASATLNIDKVIELEEGENICFVFRSSDFSNATNISNLLRVIQVTPIDVKLSQVTEESINFDNALSEFKIKDFISEIIWRFGLTIFAEDNKYLFRTLGERITTAETVDWSKKYQYATSEQYTYGSYAQRNYLTHKYNDEENTHHDGFISVANANLEAEKVIIKSNIYAPEKQQTWELPSITNVYPLWQKEVNETNGEQVVSYKSLDKRFYFLRSNIKTFDARKIGSKQLTETTTITSAPFESYVGLSFSDFVQSHYSEVQNILNRAKLLSVKMYLTPKDIADFDFKKLYFIEQLGGYFLVNKINNWVNNKLCDVELIKVEYAARYTPVIVDDTIVITTFEKVDYDAYNWQITINYTTELEDMFIKLWVNNPNDGQMVYNSNPLVFLQPKSMFTPVYANLYLTNLDQSHTSNSVSFWI